MNSRVWALAGLACGVLAGLAIVVAAVALAPEPGTARASSPAPSAAASGFDASAAATPASAARSAAIAGASPSGSGPRGSSVMHIGEPAPSLVVPQVGGGMVDVSSVRGRPAWVSFVSTACDACRDQLSLMGGFLARYSSTGLVVLAIDVKDGESAAAALATKAGVTFPFGLDADGRAQTDWEVPSLPSHFWIDSAGVVRDAAGGAIDGARMARGLGSILSGVTVTP